MPAHKKKLQVKKLDPSWLMLDPYLRWIYTSLSHHKLSSDPSQILIKLEIIAPYLRSHLLGTKILYRAYALGQIVTLDFIKTMKP